YTSATDDVLLNATMMRLILKALPSPLAPGGTDEFAQALRRSAFFNPDGNRQGGQGEFVVCLRPQRKGAAVLAAAPVEVWRSDGQQADGMRWQRHRSFEIRYDKSGPEGGPPHAGP